ncbi:MAG: ROK family protein [Microthrixaceae bacterium]
MTGPAGALGVDLGGTKARSVLLVDGEVRWDRTDPTGRDLGPERATDLLLDVLAAARAAVGPAGVATLGIGVPGPVRPGTGVVRSSVILDGWEEVPFADLLAERTGLAVGVDNDVNHAARAEWWTRSRAGGPAPDLLFVGIGTGVGGAMVLDGRVWAGAGGMAGEIGHVAGGEPTERCDCGRLGCVSVSVGGRALERRLGLASGGLAAAVAAGGPAADLLAEGARRLGAVVADALHLLDLPLVVLGGGVAEAPAFVDGVREGVAEHALAEVRADCRVEAAAAGYDAAAVGAALHGAATV